MNPDAYDVVCAAADRDQWLEARREGLGASEVAGVLRDADGDPISRWHSPLSIALSKVALDDDDTPSELAETGHWLEPVIGERFVEETGRGGRPCGLLLRSREYDWLQATLDWWTWPAGERVDESTVPLEIKHTVYLTDEWEIGVPRDVLIQVQTQMIVTGDDHGFVAALLGGRFRWRRVDADPELQREIIETTSDYWARLEEGVEIEPDGHRATAEALRKLYPQDNGRTIALPGEAMALVEDVQNAKNHLKHWTIQERAAKNKLAALLGENVCGKLPDGREVTYKTIERVGYEVQPVKFRQLRVPTGDPPERKKRGRKRKPR